MVGHREESLGLDASSSMRLFEGKEGLEVTGNANDRYSAYMYT